ncbi:MAG: C_GCAxxG_C_C family protein [Oscillospiraceae bacterium]|nr:C_GCAxxG_C_C family protein [Oscillospiraceae bacterium]
MAYDMTALHKNMYSGEYCCAPVMFKTALDLEDEECEIATNAMKGLCGGMKSGMVCGVLTGACCMISYLAPEDADDIIPELTKWFTQEMTDRYGGYNCADIRKTPEDIVKCQNIMEQTYQKCMELLEEKGYEYE